MANPRRQRLIELLAGNFGSQLECFVEAYKPRARPDLDPKKYRQRLGVMAGKACNHPIVKRTVDAVRVAALTDAATAHEVMRRVWAANIATDRNEIAQVRRVPCRHCYGVGHMYQETPDECRERKKLFTADLAAMMRKGVPSIDWPRWDSKGGQDYTNKRPPHPECPECHGDGVPQVFVKDTRYLSPAARQLYEGVDVKNGQLVVKFADRAAAEDKLAKSLGMFVDKHINLNVNANLPIPDDPAAAADAYRKLISGNG